MPATASKQSDTATLVNISTQIWPPRHRTYFGSPRAIQTLSPSLKSRCPMHPRSRHSSRTASPARLSSPPHKKNPPCQRSS